jgi:hypothetical protein
MHAFDYFQVQVTALSRYNSWLELTKASNYYDVYLNDIE